MSNEPELINIPRTIHIYPINFKRLLDNPLVENNFDVTKVDILSLKEAELKKGVRDNEGWFKKEGADKYSNDAKRKLFVFAAVAKEVMNVTITYSPQTHLYFIENNGTLKVINGWVYSWLYSGSLIYKDSSRFSLSDLEFVIRQRVIQETLVLTGYFRYCRDETSVLFNFPIKLALTKEVAKNFGFELEEINESDMKGGLDEPYDISLNVCKSESMRVDEYEHFN